VSLPGGRHEAHDPHLLATAIREAREEVGIELSAAPVLGTLPTLLPYSSGPDGIEVTPYVFSAPSQVTLRTSDEAEAAFWLPLREVIAGTLDSTYEHTASARVFPSWRFQGYVVWGLTMRILRDLLERIAPPLPIARSKH
jgi:8-oxo-dGTP pyrophosphatase MutT (NUDIX family)